MRTFRSPRSVIHTVAQCRDCGWLDDDYKLAARRATQHTRETGHTVSVDQGIVYTVRAKP